jgi:hypothetical protein
MSWSTSASRFVNFSWKLDEAGEVRKLRDCSMAALTIMRGTSGFTRLHLGAGEAKPPLRSGAVAALVPSPGRRAVTAPPHSSAESKCSATRIQFAEDLLRRASS